MTKKKPSLGGTTIRMMEFDQICIKHGADQRYQVLVSISEATYRACGNLYKMGIAEGHDLLYCVSLGLKYCKNFSRDAWAYRVMSRKQKTVRCEMIKSDCSSEFVDRQVEALKVIFYGRKHKRKSPKKNKK